MTEGQRKGPSLIIPSLHRDAFRLLRRNDPLVLASATSFFATFSISPAVIILVNVLGIYFQNDEVKGQLLKKIEGMFGEESSRFIESVVGKVSNTDLDWLTAIFGFLFLLFVATTMLKIVREAIHKIWKIKRKDVSRLKYTFAERSLAAAILLITGLLVGVSTLADTSLALLNNYFSEELPALQVTVIRILNIVLSVAIGTVWFMLLFKVLPDAKNHWRVCLGGGFITALLFSLGKFILGKLILYNTLAQYFGPSASFVLILLFIFYSSLILYYGVAFTYVYAQRRNMPIQPGRFSEEYTLNSVHEKKD